MRHECLYNNMNSEKKKSAKGYIWRGGRDIESEKHNYNYAERILKSQKNKLKKKRRKKPKTSSGTNSIAIQSDYISSNKQKQQKTINNFFNPSHDEKEESVTRTCCYHCLSLLMVTQRASCEEDTKSFCDDECLRKYIESTMIKCANQQCHSRFLRTNGYRFEAQWLCKNH
eukprot:575286_1